MSQAKSTSTAALKELAALQVEKAGINGERQRVAADFMPVRYLATLLSSIASPCQIFGSRTRPWPHRATACDRSSLAMAHIKVFVLP
jgi:hypothetical protein